MRLWQHYCLLGFQTPRICHFRTISEPQSTHSSRIMSNYRGSERGPQLRTVQISYLAGDDSADNTLNLLLALLTRASPILATITRDKDTPHARCLKEYFTKSANAHWAALIPKSRTLVQEPQPWAVKSADLKKVSYILLIVFPTPHPGFIGQIIP